MSTKSRAGKAAWAARAATYHQDLADQIATDAQADMDRWAKRGRIPTRVRVMARLSGQRLQSPEDGGQR